MLETQSKSVCRQIVQFQITLNYGISEVQNIISTACRTLLERAIWRTGPDIDLLHALELFVSVNKSIR